jgi:hypothetical protein
MLGLDDARSSDAAPSRDTTLPTATNPIHRRKPRLPITDCFSFPCSSPVFVIPIATTFIKDIKSELVKTHMPHDYKVFNKVLQFLILRYPKTFVARVIQVPEELITSKE